VAGSGHFVPFGGSKHGKKGGDIIKVNFNPLTTSRISILEDGFLQMYTALDRKYHID
jgi:hypothetical protein